MNVQSSNPSLQASTLAAQDAGPDAQPATPWWRFPMVWMVIAGPALVVVASFATLTLAIMYPDPVLTTKAPTSASEVPAMQGRNHAATPKP